MIDIRHARRFLPAVLGAALLAACSGNMTGGATPPVQPQQGAPAVAVSGVVPQGYRANGQLQTPPAPIPAASADVSLSVSPTPIVLPGAGGYGGKILVSPATPLPSDAPALGLTLQPQPKNAPLRDNAPKNGASLPVLMLALRSETSDAILVGGFKGVNFTLPAAVTKPVKHYALGLFETDLPPGPHALFRRRKSASTALLAIDDKTKLDASGQTVSSTTVPFALAENHHYALVLYVDHTPAAVTPVASATPAVAASSSPGSVTTPAASPSASPTPAVTPSATVSGH